MRMALLALALLAACDTIPRDPDGTLERIRAERSFRVGLALPHDGAYAAASGAFLARVAAAAGARPTIEHGAAEPLLKRLEGGELELVIGAMHDKSPWAKAVSFLPPLLEETTPHGRIHLLPIARNGENAWISLLHAEARKTGAPS